MQKCASIALATPIAYVRRKTRVRAAMVTRRPSGEQATRRWSIQTAARLRRRQSPPAEETATQPISPGIPSARKPELPREPRPASPDSDAVEAFPRTVIGLIEQHRPSRMPFFQRLRSLPLAVAGDPEFLGDVHLVYQAAMHATRAAVYYLPHLDSPALRKRKLQIFNDDDGLADGDTHHYQLTRAFQNIGAKVRLTDEAFGGHEALCEHLDAETAHFVRLAKQLYARSLGPWCAVEVMSVDWMRALAESFAVHFPQFAHEPYFEDCFSRRVEERHAQEALNVTQTVLRERPELLADTLRDAKMMAEALDGVWTNLDRIVQAARQRTRR